MEAWCKRFYRSTILPLEKFDQLTTVGRKDWVEKVFLELLVISRLCRQLCNVVAAWYDESTCIDESSDSEQDKWIEINDDDEELTDANQTNANQTNANQSEGKEFELLITCALRTLGPLLSCCRALEISDIEKIAPN